MTALLQADGLVKRYQEVTAVDGVSFSIEAGVCFGLLGPNGAGKTTTVEMLEGITTPTSGGVRYKGGPLGQRFRNEAGIMFQTTALQDYITVHETLEMFGRLYPESIPREQLIEHCALEEFLDRDTRKLSGGQHQRLLLAISLVNNPEVVFLDEPTTGLDPQARHNFWDLLSGIKAQGKTVILTTHYMEEAYTLCDEIIIMDHGRIIAQDTPNALLAQHFNDVVLQLPKEDFRLDGAEMEESVMETQDSIEILSNDVNATLHRLMAQEVPLANLRIRQRTLEDLFLELTGKELRA